MTLKWSAYILFLTFVFIACSSAYEKEDWLPITMAPAVFFETSLDSILEKTWFQSLIISEELDQKLARIYPSIQFFKQEIELKQEAIGFIATNASSLDLLFLKKIDQSTTQIIKRLNEQWPDLNLNKLKTEAVDLYELFPNTDSTQYIAIEKRTLLLSNRALAIEEAILFLKNPPEEISISSQEWEDHGVIIHAADVLWQYLSEREKQDIPTLTTKKYFQANKEGAMKGQEFSATVEFCESKIDEAIFTYLPTFLMEWSIATSCSLSIESELQDWMAEVFAIGKAARKEGDFVLLIKKEETAFQNWINSQSEKGKIEEIPYGAFQIVQYVSGEIKLGEDNVLINPYIIDFGEAVLLIENSNYVSLWIDYYILSKTFSNQVGFLQVFEKNKEQLSYLDYRSKTVLKKWYTEFLMEENSKLNGLLITKKKSEAHVEFEANPLVGEVSLLTPEIIWRKDFAVPVKGNILVTEDLIIAETEAPDIHFLDEYGNQKQIYLLEDSILGNIHKVDEEAKNIWFHTATSLFIFTREGHLWSSFPVTLPHQVVVDATKIEFIEGQAQWFFPFGKNGVYAIDENGSVVESWAPNLKADSTDLMIQFIQKPEADYVFSWTKNGRVQAISRNGEVRFERKFSTSFQHSPSIQQHPLYDRVVNIDTANYLYVINLLGAHFRIALNEEVDQYLFHDFFGDSRKDVIIRSGNKVKSYGYNEQNQFLPLHEFLFESAIDEIFLTGNHVGVLQKQSRKIYLLDKKLILHPSFPLEGTTPFQYIKENGEEYVIVGLGNQLIKYQLFD